MLARRLLIRTGLLAAVAAVLEGCGFQPVYGQRDDGQSPVEKLAEIEVALLDGRNGQVMRQALQRRLEGAHSSAAKLYDLTVNYNLSEEGVALQRSDSHSTRIRAFGTASWTLLARDASRTSLASGFARSGDGFNQFDNQDFYGDLAGEKLALRVADQLADQIAVALAGYFRGRGDAS